MKTVKEFYAKYKVIVWPIFTALASLTILTLVIIPQINAILHIRNQVTDLQKTANFLEVKAKDLEQLDETVGKRSLDIAFTVLPARQDVPEAITILQGLIANSGLILKNTTYSASSKSSRTSSFSLNVTAEGSLEAVRSFLTSLQLSPRIFRVESLTVHFREQGSLVEVEIPISVLYSEAPPQTSSPTEPVPKLSEQENLLLAELSRFVPVSAVYDTDIIPSVPLGKSNPFE